MNRLVSSKHLESVSDLTLSAPIKQGFIDAFEAVTYETRLSKLLEALFKIRSTAREHSEIKPFVDTAERIQSLLDFRLAIVDGEPRRLLLSATFDRAFEPYMRLIWDPLGPLLDVIFCNCEGYVKATGHSFEEYLAWVRSAQIDTDYFYSASGHSVNDNRYLLRIEKLQRERHLSSGTTVYVPDPETEASQVRQKYPWESAFLGMEALVALYRLTDFYPPDDPEGDGELLRTAAQQLLAGWGTCLPKLWKEELIPEQLAWFRPGEFEPESEKDPDEKRADLEHSREMWQRGARLKFSEAAVQGGIVTRYDDCGEPIRHGALLLMRIHDPEAARKFVAELPVRSGDPKAPPPSNRIFLNLAFTWRGLGNIGVPAAELQRFPQEFREGMEERAGVLGDIRASHPRRWQLPERNWRDPATAAAAAATVEFSEVDMVIQLRTPRHAPKGVLEVNEKGHPLRTAVCRLAAKARRHGVELLAVQPMRRAVEDSVSDDEAFTPIRNGEGKSRMIGKDHFGFVDGLSQPHGVEGVPERWKDEVAMGELFWGYPNDRSDPPPPPSAILDNGTFLVVRKLRMNVGRLRRFVERAAERAETEDEIKIDPETIYGKMVGRLRCGKPLVGKYPNKIDFADDPEGYRCPFQAHIRRANPRAPREGRTGRPTPRILRRGLSYGPPCPPTGDVDDRVNRGVVFMAYGASIAEQYEVIQRWVNAGNSTGVGSWLIDPLMGPAQPGDSQVFRFRYCPEHPYGATYKICPDKERETLRFKLKKPFVELQWGTYLFVPSMAAIRQIARPWPIQEEEERADAQGERARNGQRIVERLQALAASGAEGRIKAAAEWKTYLEDFMSKDPAERAEGPAIWAAIRSFHGGALRVPYGIVAPGEMPREVVLIASKELVMRVFRDKQGQYSMAGQMRRMEQSFGRIFLGLDDGEEYRLKAQVNLPIYSVTEEQAFSLAYRTAAARLAGTMETFCKALGPEDKERGIGRWGELDLRRDYVTPVLAGICYLWFGIPDKLRAPGPFDCHPNHVDPGGWSWQAIRKPRCPGDFLATSRYCFYPDPVPRVQAYGKSQGQALRKAVRAHFETVAKPGAPIAKAMADICVYNDDRDEFARTLIGVMTGFLPPADATLRWTLYEWLEEKHFWRIQQDFLSVPRTPPAPGPAPEGTPCPHAGPGVTDGLPTIPPPDDEACRSAFTSMREYFMDAQSPEAVGPAVHDSPTQAEVEAAYRAAKKALKHPLMQAMQKRPSPDMLWRTSVCRHRLGSVDVEDGDRVFIGIVSAMAEDVEAGVTEVYPVFGGRREWDGIKKEWVDGPRHACPAYKFAMGTLMGIIAALMDRVTVQALPAPLLVKISDRQPCPCDPEENGQAPCATAGSPPAHEESSGS